MVKYRLTFLVTIDGPENHEITEETFDDMDHPALHDEDPCFIYESEFESFEQVEA